MPRSNSASLESSYLSLPHNYYLCFSSLDLDLSLTHTIALICPEYDIVRKSRRLTIVHQTPEINLTNTTSSLTHLTMKPLDIGRKSATHLQKGKVFWPPPRDKEERMNRRLFYTKMVPLAVLPCCSGIFVWERSFMFSLQRPKVSVSYAGPSIISERVCGKGKGRKNARARRKIPQAIEEIVKAKQGAARSTKPLWQNASRKFRPHILHRAWPEQDHSLHPCLSRLLYKQGTGSDVLACVVSNSWFHAAGQEHRF